SAAVESAAAAAPESQAATEPAGSGRRQPRAGLWSLCTPLLVAADALSLADVSGEALAEAADLLDDCAGRYGPLVGSFENPAKALAVQLMGSVPLVWGAGELAGVAAYRFACQMNENAKYASSWGVLPEVLHNQVVAMDGPFASAAGDENDFFRDRLEDPFGSPRLHLVLLRDDAGEGETLARHREAVAATATGRGVPVSEVTAEGEHPLSRLAGLVAATDYTSVYLALVLGVDPTPVPSITDVKKRVSR
ncbi:MAG: SIS domain-containing protein, partial [Actinomycetes bacterium]